MKVVTSGAAWCPVSHENEDAGATSKTSWLLKHPVSTKGVLLSFQGPEILKNLLRFFGARKFHFMKYKIFFILLTWKVTSWNIREM